MNDEAKLKLNKLTGLVIVGHKGQYRRTKKNVKKVPFVFHPIGVSFLVINYFKTSGVGGSLPDLVSAALAHDLLEDTEVGEDEIREVVSARALEIIKVLTRLETNVNYEENQEKYAQGIKRFGDEAIYVKICDNIHNLSHLNTTPEKLLEKTINKARDYYLPLFEGSRLSKEFELVYRKAIGDAEEYIGIGVSKWSIENTPS